MAQRWHGLVQRCATIPKETRMANRKRKPGSTTRSGLGWTHQQQVQRLHRNHIDGTACWWCGQPMFRDKTKNWDGLALHGDHTVARSQGGTVADRLLHATCNVHRRDGSSDDTRPALGVNATSQHPLGDLVMGWPTG
jgi:hypothetical protein